MPDFKPLYRYSFYEAMRLSEQDQWRESFAENQRCRDFIDGLVRENFDGMHIKGEIPQKTVAEFGFDRTRWVLANHIQYYDYDGRISPQNKVWASDIYIPRPEKRELRDHNTSFLLNSHNTLVDYLADQVQQMYAALNLYDHRHRIHESEMSDYKSKVLILRDTALKEAYRTPENQLFFAESGFGCDPSASGRAVFGKFLIDGEKARFDRSDFVGVVDDKYLPEWAKNALHSPEKLAELKPADAPDEGSQPVMKGM